GCWSLTWGCPAAPGRRWSRPSGSNATPRSSSSCSGTMTDPRCSSPSAAPPTGWLCADEADVTAADRVIAAAVNGDGAELSRLAPSKPRLDRDDHRMLGWVIE